MRPWILHYAKQGIKEFAISSSGNSAISAAKYCKEAGLALYVFVRPDIEAPKISILRRNENVVLSLSKTPQRDCIRFAKIKKIINLRASRDDNALLGYEEIARELCHQLPAADNIFIPASSGATLEGMYQGFKKDSHRPPSFFAVQTAKVHPIASYFDKDFLKENTSYATSIVDNIAHRKDRIIKIIEETGGGGFVISNKELEQARALLIAADKWLMTTDTQSVKIGQQSEGISSRAELGWHSVLSFAGFLKWQRQNLEIAEDKISVCIFTD